MKPQPGEIIQDPAAGTGGFLIAADRYIKQQTDDLVQPAARSSRSSSASKAFDGVELVPDTHRLLLMNAMLHGIESDLIAAATRSRRRRAKLPKADVILTNPPFGTKKGGGLPTRDDFTYPTSNKQLAFLQHIYRGLQARRPRGGGAAGQRAVRGRRRPKIRADLMDKCDLHTILRLPTGIFYAQGVKTNVLFFTREARTTRATRRRCGSTTCAPTCRQFGKRTPFTREHFAEFVKAFGNDPLRQEQAEGPGRRPAGSAASPGSRSPSATTTSTSAG